MTIDHFNILKFVVGIICCILSAFSSNIILGQDPDSSNLFWLIPGLIFGLALTIPNLFNIEGVKWKLVSMFCFPIFMICIWVINLLFAGTLGGAVSSLLGVKIGISFIGFFSAFTAFGAFNFFYSRPIKLLNYVIVGVLGALSFLVVDILYLTKGEGMTNHFDKLLYFWQILVGVGISLSFKKENLKLFLR